MVHSVCVVSLRPLWALVIFQEISYPTFAFPNLLGGITFGILFLVAIFTNNISASFDWLDEFIWAASRKKGP